MSKKKVVSKKEIPQDETKGARFLRVVTPRVNKAIKAISVIGFCAGGTYDYTEQQARQIIDELIKAVGNLDSKFSSSASADAAFEFSE